MILSHKVYCIIILNQLKGNQQHFPINTIIFLNTSKLKQLFKQYFSDNINFEIVNVKLYKKSYYANANRWGSL